MTPFADGLLQIWRKPDLTLQGYCFEVGYKSMYMTRTVDALWTILLVRLMISYCWTDAFSGL